MYRIPSPARQISDIRYQISSADGGRPTAVTLKVYGLSGRVVKALVDREQGAGYYSVRWDRKDDAERMVAPGVYFYRLTTGSFRATRKMVVLR